MRRTKQWLSVVLAAMLVTGTLQVPVYAGEIASTADAAEEAEEADNTAGASYEDVAAEEEGDVQEAPDDTDAAEDVQETPDEEQEAAQEEGTADVPETSEKEEEQPEAEQSEETGSESGDSEEQPETSYQTPEEETVEIPEQSEEATEAPEASTEQEAVEEIAEEISLSIEEICAFQDKIGIWKTGDRIFMVCNSSEDMELGYSIYYAGSDDLILNGDFRWSGQYGLYYVSVSDGRLEGSSVKIVLSDGTNSFEETVSGNLGRAEISREAGETDTQENAETDAQESEITAQENAETDAQESAEYTEDEAESEETVPEEEPAGDLIWESVTGAEGYFVRIIGADDATEVYTTSECRIGADRIEGAEMIEVAPYSLDRGTGVKLFGEAAAYSISDAEEEAETEEITETEESSGSGTAEETGEAEELIETAPGQYASNADTASTNPTSGTCGENLTWVLSGGTLTISGTGAMTDFSSGKAPWYASRKEITSLVVKEGVTTVGAYALYYCSNLTAISLPQSLTTIGRSAFDCTSGPAVLNLPGNLTSIGIRAFNQMTKVEQITIPDSVTSIGTYAFKYCWQLNTVSIGDGVTAIKSNTFEGDTKLTKLTLPSSLSSIGNEAFMGCKGLTSISLPNTVKSIGDNSFINCTGLRTVTLSGSLQSIGSTAFSNCTSLTQVTLPNSVTNLGTGVFSGCTAMTKVTLSSKLKDIPDQAFKGCSVLSSISFPDSIRTIGNQAFYECTSLTAVTLPSGLEYLGSEAFLGCTSLKKVTLPDVTFEAGQNIFSGCPSDMQYLDSNSNVLTDVTLGEITPAETNNQDRQNYSTYASPTYSYIVDADTQRLRVEYSGGTLTREYYTADGKLVSRTVIPVELPLFGGFFEGEDSYYLIFGQNNEGEDDSKEVYRIVRYTKDWVRKGAASICGANTVHPFEAGTASMSESGGMLYLRTCREKYTSDDGYNHQANLTAVIRESDMKVTWICSAVSGPSAGYVSHSFNQIIRTDGDDVIAVDHGDYNPRAVVLFRYADKAGAEDLGYPQYVNILSIKGSGNYTGVSVGALEASSSYYLVAGNSIDQSTSSSSTVRNIFVAATSKSNFTTSGTTVRWVTSYTGSEKVSTPVMTALPDGRYLLMWTVDGTLNYCFVKATGVPESTIYTGIGSLSDCKPYVKNNTVWWYVTTSTAPVYYYISLSSPGTVHVENAGHTLTLDPMGGTIDGDTQMEVEHGSTYGTLPTPTREAGYKFLGWFTGPKYGTKVTSTSTIRVRDAETLYAHWQHNWSFSEDTGTMNLVTQNSYSTEWSSLKSKVKIAVIGDDVTKLYPSQFYGFSNLKTVIMSDSVTEVSQSAFYNTSVTDVYFLGTEEAWNSIKFASGNDRLTGAQITFVEDEHSLNYAKVEGISDKTYTGLAITQQPVVSMLGTVLTQNTDYTVSYSNNTKVGTATVKITGKGDYTGSVSKTFAINAASISGATVTGLSAATYTGQAVTQTPVVKVGTKTLTSGTDYTVTYSNNTNAGTATVKITGKGNYTGTVNKTFTINAASISGATVTGITASTYTGKAITKTIVVKSGTTTLKSGTDYSVSYSNNTNVGTATVKITGKGNYTGTINKTFKINAASINGASVSGLTAYAYTGEAITQTPVVTVGSNTLVEDKDYTLSYLDNVNAGTATMTITGTGNYTGTVSKSFAIYAVSVEGATVTGISDVMYTGKAITQTPVVELEGKTLTAGTDYTVSYTNNINAGTATVKILGKGNYGGTVSKTFKIKAVSMSGAAVSGLKAATYTGQAIEQAPVVKIGTTTLRSGTDYTVTYLNNTNAGTATVKITGKGNYTGTVRKTFKINAASVSGADISGLADSVYTGSEIGQEIVVKVGANTLEPETDYTVAYADNINAGTATVTITGQGNYTGTKKAAFTIAPAEQTVTVQSSAKSAAVGKTAAITVTGNEGEVSFESSNPAVATVAEDGTVKAIKVGTVRITVTSAATENYKECSSTVTLKVVPAATTSFKATNMVTGIKLTWNKVAGANGYIIYRGKTKIATIDGGATVSYIDTTANTNGTKYTFKIIAKAATGNSTLSRTVAIYRLTRHAFTSVTSPSTGRMTTKWARNAQATGYQVQYATNSKFTGLKSTTLTNNKSLTKTFTGLTKGKTYYVRIRTYKKVGTAKYYSLWSKTRKVTVK